MGIKITGLFEPSAGAGAFALVNADDIQFDAGPEVTLDVNGDFTQPSSFHFTLDTYADAASDNVRNIARDANAPALIIFRPASDARTIVVEHDATGGNVSCVGGADITLDDAEDWCLLLYDSVAARWYAMSAVGGGGGGAPTDADYLVGTANAGLSAEIVVGTSPGGELGGTWASPTVDATHSGSAHHAESHTLTSHSTRAHSELTGVGTDDHHAESHTLASHSAKAHSDLTGIGSADHHGDNAHDGTILSGTVAARPAFGTADRFYWATDEHILYRDTGSAWVKAAVADHADLDGTGTDDHHAESHASRHQNGGPDEVATATPGANAIPKAGAGGKLAAGWIQEVLAYADLTDDPVGDHAAAGDPHTGYQKESEKGAANGYAPLDASSEVADAYIPASIARDSELHSHSYGIHKLLYTDGDGTITPLALGAADTVLRSAGASATPAMSAMKVSKTVIFTSPNADLAVEDWLPDQAVRVPAASKHGTWTPGTVYVRVGTAGTGTNTILFRTSTTLTGARTTRATVNLGTAREASATITWTPADGEYMWVECSAVGGTPPKKGIAQVDIEEAIYS